MRFPVVTIVSLRTDPCGLHTLACDINREDLREQLAEVEASDLDGVKKEQEEG